MCRDGQDSLLWDEPEQSSQPTPVRSQPVEDDLLDAWASLASEPDEVVSAASEPRLVDDREDSRLRAGSEQTDLKTPPVPRERAGSTRADAWASRRGDAVQRGTARRSAARPLQRDAGAPRRSGWATSGDDYSGMQPGVLSKCCVSCSRVILRHLGPHVVSKFREHHNRPCNNPVTGQVKHMARMLMVA